MLGSGIGSPAWRIIQGVRQELPSVTDWIRPRTARQVTLIGVMWVVLTLGFEIGVGRLLGASWERILSDFNLLRGGLLGIGLLIMAFSPRITASLRRMKA